MTVESSSNSVGSTMVEVAEEDLCVVLARAIGSKVEKQCSDLAGQGKDAEVCDALVGAIKDFMSKSAEGDAGNGASILAHAIAKLPQAKRDALASKFVTEVSSAANEDVALSALCRAYNTFPPHSKARLATLMSILEFAAKSGKTPNVASALKGKTELIKTEHGLSGGSYRDFLFALSGLYPGPCEESFEALNAYLASFGTGSELNQISKDKNATKVANRLVSELMRTPQHFKCDFVVALKVLGGKAHECVKILVDGSVKDMKKFCKASSAFLKELGTTEAQCVGKVRLLALAAIGAEAQKGRGGDEISYASVTEALDVSAEEVEPWLVRGIGLGILEGRMDQLHQVFKVQKTAHKTFGDDEWATLRDRLGSMHANIAGVQEKIRVTSK